MAQLSIATVIISIISGWGVYAAGPIQSLSDTRCAIGYPFDGKTTTPTTGTKLVYKNTASGDVKSCQRLCIDKLYKLDKLCKAANCQQLDCVFAILKKKQCVLYAKSTTALPTAEKAVSGDTVIQILPKCPTAVPAGVKLLPATHTIRCATPKPGPGSPQPKGKLIVKAKNKPYENAAFKTLEDCQTICVNNKHKLEPSSLCPDKGCKDQDCVMAIYQTKLKKCFLYGLSTAVVTNPKKILATDMIITLTTAACPATTTAAITTTRASVSTSVGTSVKPTATASSLTTARSATTPTASAASSTPKTVAPNCCDWAKVGECDANPYYMKLNCKVECGTPTATLLNANIIPSNTIAKCKSTLSAACKDSTPDCAVWALNRQCEINPFSMNVNCPTSCRKCTKGIRPTVRNACGNTDVPAVSGCYNSDDRCNYWALTGECINNAAWMSTGCCPACRNRNTLVANCPLVN